MMNEIRYAVYTEKDFDHLLHMSKKLWHDIDHKTLEKDLKKLTVSEKMFVLVAKTKDDEYGGFSIFSIRNDYVEGAVQSPTGYLEGIFIEEKYRKKGIAKMFIKKGEKWCKDRGCMQMGSDTWLNDKKSREFHKKVGFWEEEEVVHFLKNI